MIKNISENKFLSLSRGDFDAWEFPGESFPGANFPRTNKYINYFLKTLVFLYDVFSQL